MKFLICGLFLFYCSSKPVAPKDKVVLIALDGIKEEHINSISSIDLPKGYVSKFYGQKDNCKPSQKYNVSLPAYYTLFTGLNNSKVTSNRFIKDSYDPTLFDIYKDSIGFSSWYPLKYISSSKPQKTNFVLSESETNVDTDNLVFKDFKKYYKNQSLGFVHFTDGDNTAHNGNKVKYLSTTVDEIKYTEAIINWSVYEHPNDNFTFIVFSDHSRGNGYLWKYHGSRIPGSGKIWVFIVSQGPKRLSNCTHIGINIFVREILSYP